MLRRTHVAIAVLPAVALLLGAGEATEPRLTLSWEEEILTVQGDHLPGGRLEIWYIEAYCRDRSTDADWVEHTVVGHTTEKLELNDERTRLRLRCRVDDGLEVDHTITARADEVDFRVVARNPTDRRSEAHWAQPCVRVGTFTGFGPETTEDAYAYLERCFVFVDGELQRLPTEAWATEARYTPGQVWGAPGVPRTDLNPRPLNPRTPTYGLIGCFSADGQWILATAWEPWQELFQGVIRCIHSDFRLGGLEPGQVKRIRGKLYLVPNDVEALLQRYRRDFPEHVRDGAP